MDGPTRTLLAEEADKSRNVFWAMAWEFDGAIVTISDVESDIWADTTRGRTLLKSDSGS
jgi:hypothetical protein